MVAPVKNGNDELIVDINEQLNLWANYFEAYFNNGNETRTFCMGFAMRMRRLGQYRGMNLNTHYEGKNIPFDMYKMIRSSKIIQMNSRSDNVRRICC